MLYIPVVDSIAVAIMKVQTVSGALRLGKPNMNTIDLNRNEIPIQIPRWPLSDILITNGTMKQVPKTATRSKF